MMTDAEMRGAESTFYSPIPAERVEALRSATHELRDQVMHDVQWPMFSPGALNAWLVFLGPSPGASPGAPWTYDPLPSVGGPHPGVAEYVDGKGYWNGIRLFARAVFPELSAPDAYSATMVRNLDPTQQAVGPRGSHMHAAADKVLRVLDRLVRPVMVVALGGVRDFSDRAIANWPNMRDGDNGVLYTTRKRRECAWFTKYGRWSDGRPFLYLSATGIHPSLHHVSTADSLRLIATQASIAREITQGLN